MKEIIYHIMAEWFSDFIYLDKNDVVTHCCGGTFRYMVGWTLDKVKEHCKEKHWKLVLI